MEFQLAFSKAQEEVTTLRGENNHLSCICDQLTADKAALEADNDKLKSKIREQQQLVSNGAYMAFYSCDEDTTTEKKKHFKDLED
jgi:multidrug resistance efflux pump